MRQLLSCLCFAAFLTAVTFSIPPASGAGYAVQLAAFRSHSDALTYFRKLKARHPILLGRYRALIIKADLGTRGEYFTLRIGPIGSRPKGASLCSKLIAAGEKDCIVRRN